MPGKNVLRTGVAIFLVLTLGLAGALFCVDLTFYRALFNRGVNDFNAASYERAVPELRIAAFGFIDSLPDFEGAQIYIALASEKLSRAEDARAATLRVADAERIAPSYSGLALPDAIRSQFELLAQKHMTTQQLAMLRRPAAAAQPQAPPVVTSSGTAPVETTTTALTNATAVPTTNSASTTIAITTTEPVAATVTVSDLPPVATSAPVIAPAPPVTASVALPIVVTPPAVVAPSAVVTPPVVNVEQERLAAKQRAAAEQAETKRIAAEKAAAERAAAEKAEQARIAAARRADEKRADEKRADERRADERRAAAQKLEEDRVAAERERRLNEERRKIEARTVPATVTAGTATLRQAEAALGRGDLESARREYSELLSSQERDTLLQVAAALYRLGDFPGAMRAFGKVGALRSGEEIFRYYAAVSLYETGQYAAAKKQLACALPYIQTTPETVRYQTKIEGAINLP